MVKLIQLLVIYWDLLVVIQNHQIIAISPLHLVCELLYKTLREKEKEKEKSAPTQVARVTGLFYLVLISTLWHIFACFKKKKKSSLYESIQYIIYSVVGRSLYDKNVKPFCKNSLF